jgi:hypothetical protein
VNLILMVLVEATVKRKGLVFRGTESEKMYGGSKEYKLIGETMFICRLGSGLPADEYLWYASRAQGQGCGKLGGDM